MTEEKIGEKFKLKNIDETRSYLTKEINQYELMSKNRKKVCWVLSYT